LKCIIFLGHHKTGSSALQEFFTRNANRLRKNGVLYPFIEPKGAQYLAGLQENEVHTGALPARLRSPHNFIAYQMMEESIAAYKTPARFAPLPSVATMFADIADQVARDRPHTLLLCSEVFSHFGVRRPELVQDLLTGLGATDVSFYLTLRRPDQHICAWYSQMLKFGRKPTPLSQGGLAWFKGTSHVELARAAAPWVAAAKPQKMHLHTYAQIMQNGGVVPHFSKAVGLDISTLETVTVSTNVSIPYAFFDLCAKANTDLPRTTAARLRRMLHKHRAALPVPSNAQVEILGQQARDEIYAHAQPIDYALAQMVAKDAFFDDLDDIRQMHPMTQSAAQALALEAAKAVLPDYLTDQENDVILRNWLSAQA